MKTSANRVVLKSLPCLAVAVAKRFPIRLTGRLALGGFLVCLAYASAVATETDIIGSKGSWPSTWTEIPALRDGVDNASFPALDFVTNKAGVGTVYWAKDNDYLYFRVRVNTNTFNIANYSAAMWIYIDKFRTAPVPDYAFAWDSANTAQKDKHGLEMQVAVASPGSTWATLSMDDADGLGAAKSTVDINGSNPTNDGYMRAVWGLSGDDADTTFIDYAVSWTYLADTTRHPAFALLPTDTFNVAVGVCQNGNDHSALGTGGSSDIAGLSTFTNVIVQGGPGWSGPLSPQGQTSRTWDGGSTNYANWLAADVNNPGANWTPDALPAEDDFLVFPDSAARKSNTNNLLSSVQSVTFSSGTTGGYSINGAALTLHDGITNNITAGINTWNIATTLGAAQSFTTASGGTLDFNGTITNGGFLLTVNGAGTTLLDGLVSGTGGLTKSDAGTLTITGTNTYTGATSVNGGILRVNGSTHASSAVSVASGAMLGGSGTVNGTTSVTGTVDPGTSSGGYGTLTLKGNVSLNSASTFKVDISGANSDVIDLGGTASLTLTSGAILDIGTLVAGNTYVIARNVNQAVSGTFKDTSSNELENNSQLHLQSGWYIHYVVNGTSSYIILNQSPTPVVLLQLGAMAQNGQVTVRWSTSSETKTAGFDLHRLINGQWSKLNATLIPAQGWPNGGVGASYAVADSGATAGGTYTYKLVERTTHGQSIDYGPYERTASEFAMRNPVETTAEGVMVRWLSREGEHYRVLKCTDLVGGQYRPIAENIDATPQENACLDTDLSVNGFYRIELQPW